MPKTLTYLINFIYILGYKARTIIAKRYDPIVSRSFGNFKLKLFLSHHFVFMYKVFPLFERNLELLSLLVKKKYKTLYAIDIGANVGDTLIYMNSENSADTHIMCVEGLDFYYSLLLENAKQFNNITCVKALIGNENKSETFSVKRGQGSSLLEKSDTNNSVVQFKTLETILEENPVFKQSRLIKIDTDGFDTLIIRSSENVLRKYKPVIFFEFDNRLLEKHDGQYKQIFDLLSGIGYSDFAVFNYVGEYLFRFTADTFVHFLPLIFRLDINFPRVKYYDIVACSKEDIDIMDELINKWEATPPKKFTNLELINFIR